MRITQQMMSNNLIQNMSDGYGKIEDLQNQLSSGKKITLPSQNPTVAMMGIAYRTDVNHIEQYQNNVSTAQSWINSSDSALSQVNSILQNIRDLVSEASTDTYTSDQRAAIGQQVDQYTKQLVTLGNTQVGGQYIFSGSNSANPLLTQDSAGNVTPNSTALSNPNFSLDLSDGLRMSVNVDPNTVFTSTMFQNLNGLKDALNNPSSTGVDIGTYLGKIDTTLDSVNDAQANLGARSDRVTMISNRLDDQKTTATQIMANNEDVDYPTAIVNLNQQQNVYTASLSVGARIIQQSLVNFLQ
ncbi:flagellar hook-associated protein FlgL [Sporolactobacillus shoreae]|uniref:Flagellar hook-associated protein FlgL n=1 Tax=Sporolactobacillus shoreae TaxID=1465501 RepID=A0A4Z0GI80_9BACL|nr:flagellar hook-associated protein FlgL [Sporolactobacillus shoreae]TGA95870.1 flagellar hook-associated protein FlgL [Sporolactobacillus shoreae]